MKIFFCDVIHVININLFLSFVGYIFGTRGAQWQCLKIWTRWNKAQGAEDRDAWKSGNRNKSGNNWNVVEVGVEVHIVQTSNIFWSDLLVVWCNFPEAPTGIRTYVCADQLLR